LWQVLELLEGVEIRQDRWAMPDEAAADDEAPWLDDLDDDDEFDAASSPSSSSSTASN
jgi:hypothetical protein